MTFLHWTITNLLWSISESDPRINVIDWLSMIIAELSFNLELKKSFGLMVFFKPESGLNKQI